MKKLSTLLGLAVIMLLTAAGCKNSPTPNPTPAYTVPTTYNFTNVDYSDATTSLGMVTEMANLMKNATTGTLDGQKLKDMFANANAPFATAGYNTSGINLKSQCFSLLQTDMLNYIDSLTKVSQSSQ